MDAINEAIIAMVATVLVSVISALVAVKVQRDKLASETPTVRAASKKLAEEADEMVFKRVLTLLQDQEVRIESLVTSIRNERMACKEAETEFRLVITTENKLRKELEEKYELIAIETENLKQIVQEQESIIQNLRVQNSVLADRLDSLME